MRSLRPIAIRVLQVVLGSVLLWPVVAATLWLGRVLDLSRALVGAVVCAATLAAAWGYWLLLVPRVSRWLALRHRD